MLDADQLEALAVIPLNLTAPVPCVAPKFDPLIITGSPIAPVVIERLEIFGAGTTVKAVPLLTEPPTVTVMFPVVAPVGTGTTSEESDQLVAVPVVPLNVTVLVPWLAPKFAPNICTGVVIGARVGANPAMYG